MLPVITRCMTPSGCLFGLPVIQFCDLEQLPTRPHDVAQAHLVQIVNQPPFGFVDIAEV